MIEMACELVIQRQMRSRVIKIKLITFPIRLVLHTQVPHHDACLLVTLFTERHSYSYAAHLVYTACFVKNKADNFIKSVTNGDERLSQQYLCYKQVAHQK